MAGKDDVTLERSLDTIAAGEAPAVHIGTTAFLDADFDTRYTRRSTIGEGGMGEVLLCWDRRLGREVALKVLREAHAKSEAMGFLFEGRVQGQLEHPSIVPVYDMGTRPDGSPYFTMKRVNGATLEEVIDGLKSDDPVVTAAFSRRKLLTAFASICLALDFAHTRGVVHCDLKPANLMLGDYGEVYILDWGIARVARESVGGERTGAAPTAPEFRPGLDRRIRGTPGYMAPEQLDPDKKVDGRADVFALGAILFEMLTLKSLVEGTDTREILEATLKGADARASVRAAEREVPPELEAVCVKATALDPAERYATVRELHAAVEHFLEGDRNIELRRTLADRHVELAEAAVSRARESGGADVAARSTALREAGRALTFDPTNARAMQVVASLLTVLPDAMPPAAQAEFDAASQTSLRTGFRVGAAGLFSWYALLVPLLWMGIRDGLVTGITIALVAIAAGLTYVVSTAKRVETGWWPLLAAMTLLVGVTSRIVGPLMLTPWLALGTVATISLLQHRLGAALVVGGCAMVVGPLALELLGVLPPSYVFRDGALVIMPHMTELPRTATLAFVTTSACATIAVTGWMMARYRRLLTDAQRRLHVQAWHLRQLASVEA